MECKTKNQSLFSLATQLFLVWAVALVVVPISVFANPCDTNLPVNNCVGANCTYAYAMPSQFVISAVPQIPFEVLFAVEAPDACVPLGTSLMVTGIGDAGYIYNHLPNFNVIPNEFRTAPPQLVQGALGAYYPTADNGAPTITQLDPLPMHNGRREISAANTNGTVRYVKWMTGTPPDCNIVLLDSPITGVFRGQPITTYTTSSPTGLCSNPLKSGAVVSTCSNDSPLAVNSTSGQFDIAPNLRFSCTDGCTTGVVDVSHNDSRMYYPVTAFNCATAGQNRTCNAGALNGNVLNVGDINQCVSTCTPDGSLVAGPGGFAGGSCVNPLPGSATADYVEPLCCAGNATRECNFGAGSAIQYKCGGTAVSNCPAQVLGWSEGANTCSASFAAIPINSTSSVALNTLATSLGSGQANCMANGAWAAPVGSCAPITGPACTWATAGSEPKYQNYAFLDLIKKMVVAQNAYACQVNAGESCSRDDWLGENCSVSGEVKNVMCLNNCTQACDVPCTVRCNCPVAVGCANSFTSVCTVGGGCSVAAWNNFKFWVGGQLQSRGIPDPYTTYDAQFTAMANKYNADNNGANFGGSMGTTDVYTLGAQTVSMNVSWDGNETQLPGSFNLTVDGTMSGGACMAAPTQCPSATLAWTVGANNCSATFPATNPNTNSAPVVSTTGGAGTAQFYCNAGAFVFNPLPVAGATCANSAVTCSSSQVGPSYVSFADDTASRVRCDAIYNGIGTWCTSAAENGQVARCLDGGGGVCDASGCSDGFVNTCACGTANWVAKQTSWGGGHPHNTTKCNNAGGAEVTAVCGAAQWGQLVQCCDSNISVGAQTGADCIQYRCE